MAWASSIKSNLVHTSIELQRCIGNVNPGDVIILSPTTTTIFYDGEFTVKRNGTKTAPITIKSYNAKVGGNGWGIAFSIVGDN